MGNVTGVTDYFQFGSMWGTRYNYEYDANNRLVNFKQKEYVPPVEITHVDQDFEYNDIGNITRMAGKGGYTYHATKPHAVVQVSNLRYSYDDNGNVTMKSNSASTNGWKRKIKWSMDNMAVAISNELGYIVNYEYDYSGTRVKKMYSAGNSYKYINAYYQKRSDGLVMKHVFDGMSRIVTEQLDAGGTSRFWYHQNYVGSSVQITGSDGTVAQKNDFTPFGETAVSVTSSDTNFSDVTNIQYRYTGQEYDPETGFYNYNARLYDPEIGRFLSADSIVPDPFDAQDFNRYSYVLNNPIRYNDPTGHYISDAEAQAREHAEQMGYIAQRSMDEYFKDKYNVPDSKVSPIGLSSQKTEWRIKYVEFEMMFANENDFYKAKEILKNPEFSKETKAERLKSLIREIHYVYRHSDGSITFERKYPELNQFNDMQIIPDEWYFHFLNNSGFVDLINVTDSSVEFWDILQIDAEDAFLLRIRGNIYVTIPVISE